MLFSGFSYATVNYRRLLRETARIFLAAAFLPLLLGLAAGAQAQTMVPNDWALKPSGLGDGDQFRLMFLTSTTRNATSSDIADYDSFVQGRAAAGHSAIQSYSAQFRAVASTPTVDAHDNAMTTGTGVPIYWLGGAKVADDYADFHDGTWANPVGRDESRGAVAAGTEFWSGSNDDGTKDTAGNFDLALGGNNIITTFGNTQSGLDYTSTVPSDNKRLLGLSPVFEVGAGAPAITISGGSAVTEGTAADFTVTASPAPTANLPVNLSVADAPHSDFVSAANEGTGKTVTVPTTGSVTYSVATANNSADEPNGPVTVTVETGTGYTVGDPGTASVTVTDNDTTTVTLSGAAGDLIEGDEKNILLTLGRGLRQGETLTAPLTFAGAATRNSDYALACPSPLPAGVTCSNLNSGSASVAFTGPATGTTATSVTIELTATADNAAEATAETVEIGLGALTSTGLGGAAKGVDNLADFTIADPAPPEANFAAASSSAAENAGTHNVGVTLSFAPTANLTLDYTVGGTATSATDYAALAGTVAVTANATTVNIPVSITDDDAVEGAETVTLTLTAGSGYAVGATNVHTLTIQDNDAAPPEANFAAASSSAAENAGTHNVGVTLSLAPTANLTLNYTVGGSATSATDYAALTGEVAVAANATSVNIPVSITDDEAVEGAETVTLTLTAGSGYAVGATNVHTLTIQDNDDSPPATPEANFAAVSSSAAENAGAINVGVTLNPAPTANLTLNYTVGGTATSATDYAALTGEVAVAANATTVNIPVSITDDAAAEGAETVTLTLAAGSGYAVGATNVHTLTIQDNDDSPPVVPPTGPPPSTPEVTLSASPNPVTEGETITVTATLSEALATDVTIPLAITAGTAEAGDYGPLASIAIAANETSGTGDIATNVDDDADDETFTVALGDLPGGVQPGAPASVELTITDAQSVTSVEGEEEIPEAFALEQNYPNPFNPSTTIRFALDKAQRVRLTVYDLLGQEVRVLVDGVRPAARYDVAFDAADLASGTYLYVLRAESQVAVKTMSLLK